jgi:hypothetical protein
MVPPPLKKGLTAASNCLTAAYISLSVACIHWFEGFQAAVEPSPLEFKGYRGNISPVLYD